MKIITTFYQLNNLETLSSYVDGFLIGNDQYGTRLTKSFETSEMIEALNITQRLNKKLFLLVNQMFTDDHLEALKKWFDMLPVERFEGIIVADLGVVNLLKKLGLNKKTIYHPETLLTNAYDFNYLAKEAIYGAFVAKEITLDNVISIGKKKKYALFMVGHGHLNMFYSKRQLIDNFMTFTESKNIYHNQQNLTLIEETRKEDPYPILEDFAGTHVFRSQVFSTLQYLEELSEVVDYLVIDTLFKNDQYALQILMLYNQKRIDDKVINRIKNDYSEKWDTGFLYKKTIYKQKDKR
ncbi:MAG: U32 family peptidase [Acholeplasmataceae bacterium]|nr:U32 family peptidase [Acholeplasmataceae bacterium]